MSFIRSVISSARKWLPIGALAAMTATSGNAQDYGKVGEPIKLVIGYQPYWTPGFAPAILRSKEMWRKYLPAGSTVEFQVGLQGAIIVNAMLAGKQQIGYMGEMPSIVAVTKNQVADLKMVAVLGMSQDVCNVLLVRKDAPAFNSPAEAIQWVNGKQFATPRGACSDRFAQTMFRKAKVQPAVYSNQSIEVISTNFKAGKIDAAVVWEPTATKLIEEGIAKRVASGVNVGESDGGFVVMRADLIKQRPDVAKGWLQAELDAQMFTLDPKNAKELMQIVSQQISGFSEKTLWNAHSGQVPSSQGGSPVKFTRPFGFTNDVMTLISDSTTFLHSMKAIDVEKLRADAVYPDLANQVLKERGMAAPIGRVDAQAQSPFGK